MNDPAFPTYRTFSGNYGQPINKMVEGISQRRLLAGMILQGIVCAMLSNSNNVGWTVEGNVRAAIQCADELIKQTEET